MSARRRSSAAPAGGPMMMTSDKAREMRRVAVDDLRRRLAALESGGRLPNDLVVVLGGALSTVARLQGLIGVPSCAACGAAAAPTWRALCCGGPAPGGR